MRHRFRGPLTLIATAAVAGILLLILRPAAGQAPAYEAPRASDGTPNLNGIWQALNTAHWDIEDHPAGQGPVIALGAAFSVPAGQGVVEGNAIR